MSTGKIALYVGNFSFPLGNAAGKRVYANGKILRELGYEVVFIGMDKEASVSEPLKKTRKEYDGFTYYNFTYPHGNLDWIKYKRIFNELIDFLFSEKMIKSLGFIIYYGSPRLSFFNTILIDYCKVRDIKVVADCVDWLTTKTKSFAFNTIKWVDNTYQIAYANKKADGVIAISSYLSNYYKKHGCLTVTIPPLSPIGYGPVKQEYIQNDKKIISYAGLPFRKDQKVNDCNTLKDRIDKTISLFCRAKQNGCEFVFNIYGFTKDEYLKVIPKQKKYVNELEESIVFHGLKSNKEVIDSVINSDFTILIRDMNRDTTAGFPTKFSESISLGTPVITTRTSDLSNYLVEGKNGYFLDFDEEIAIIQLIDILSRERNTIMDMKRYCIQNNLFYYKHFVNKMELFLNELGI